MTKKILIVLTILFATLFLGSSVFAATAVENGTKDIGTEVKDSWDKLGGAVQNIGNNAKNAVSNADNSENSSMTTNNNTNTNNTKSMLSGTTNNNGYSATRTSAVGNNVFGMNSTAWTWFILAVVGAIIIALVWYYSSEHANSGRSNNSNR